MNSKINSSITLILFTNSYPYDVGLERTFLYKEVEYLALNFDKVIIVPGKLEGKKHNLPIGIEVEESYAGLNREEITRRKIHSTALLSKIFYEQIIALPSILLDSGVRGNLELFTKRAYLTQKWIVNFIESKNLDTKRCIFYTYWFRDTSFGIGLAKKYYPQIKLISRAHNIDIYEERQKLNYIPYRRKSLMLLDRLFPDSESGTRYIVNRYPWFAPFCETSLIGSVDSGFVAASSTDGVFRLVSNSFILPVKRLDLLVKGLAQAGNLRPNQKFEWYHFGDGPLENYIKEMVRNLLPLNLKSFFMGYVALEDIISFYKNNPVDLFLNVSEYEGTPFSIMEAISCSIPVIATKIGGNPEIVSEKNGKLLSPDPTPDEIAKTIFDFIDNPIIATEKGRESRRIWQKSYNADKNLQDFALKIKNLI